MTCPTGKTCYPNAQLAQQALRAVQRRRKGHAEHSAYRCPHCPHWHLTGAKDRYRRGTRT